MKKIATPSLDREAEAREQGSQAIGEFLAWLLDRYDVCKFTDGGWTEAKFTTQPGFRPDERGLCTSCMEVRSTCECPDRQVLLVEREWIEEGWSPVHHSINEWIADYFGIDLDESERERRAILDALRDS